MNELTLTLVRLAIATLVAAKNASLANFTDHFREIEREVLRGRDDLPAEDSTLRRRR